MNSMEQNYNIAGALAEVAARTPEHIALIVKSRTGYRKFSFRQLNRTADGFAGYLTGQGVARGDRVMLMIRPSLEFIALTFALFKIGAVVILIDPGMGYKNLRRCIARVAPLVFIGIPKAHLFKFLFPQPFKTVRTSICIGSGRFPFTRSITADGVAGRPMFPAVVAAAEEPAAILFTTGSTGPPKGVVYTHGIFWAQLRLIGEYYGIGPADIDQPAFPLFALFSTALGTCAVIPDMDPARPAAVNPQKFVQTIMDHRVTYSFGSPAIWNVVSRYCLENRITLPSLKKVLMAGAPVPGELVERVRSILPPAGEIHTPYGATESLPVSSITGSEILAETWAKTETGQGVCVGRPLPGITISIIPVTEGVLEKWRPEDVLPAGAIGEIAVKGAVVTRQYADHAAQTRLAKIPDSDGFWHRMGDVGYKDDQGRLWFCGRKDHRVITKEATLYTIPCEAIINRHRDVYRSALVGVGPKNEQIPVIIVELFRKPSNPQTLLAEIKGLARQHPLTHSIEHFFIHPSFPVDIRHNAKIFREKLAIWAGRKLSRNEAAGRLTEN